MKIFHHNDDDGRFAATVVRCEMSTVYSQVGENDFVEYNHGWSLRMPEINEGETVYIVDLSLDDTIMGLIRTLATEHKCKIVHIDHHQSTLDYMGTLRVADRAIMDEVTKFYKIGISATLLTYVYACMYPEEREHPMDINFDFSEKRTHFKLNIESENEREYRVPPVIRYVDDNDVWRHEIEETKYFSIAALMLEDKKPAGKTLSDLIYGSDYNTIQLVKRGELLYEYQTMINGRLLSNAFEFKFEGMTVLCMNNCYGNSRIFGDRYDQYPVCIKYHFDGKIGMWRYTMYRSNNYTGDVETNLAKIAAKYGGGGHANAAGFQLPYNLFDKKTNVRKKK